MPDVLGKKDTPYYILWIRIILIDTSNWSQP